MIVSNIVQTCSACPSQWEGKLQDGRMFYARYRWGTLTIEVSREPTDDIEIAMIPDGILFYTEKLGDAYDGILEQNKLINIMSSIGFTF